VALWRGDGVSSCVFGTVCIVRCDTPDQRHRGGFVAHILHGYQLTVRSRHDSEEQILGNFDGAGADLLALLTSFLTDPNAKAWDDELGLWFVRVEGLLTPPKPTDQKWASTVAARVRAGEGGVSSQIVERGGNATEVVRFNREASKHVEYVDLVVLAHLPGTKTKGFMVTHSPHGRGIKTKFWEAFREWFRDRYPEHILTMNPCSKAGFFKALIDEADLKKITLVRQVKPSDSALADAAIWFEDKNMGDLITVISPRRNRFLRKQLIRDALDDAAKLDALLIFRGDHYDEVRATFRDAAGRTHSLRLDGTGRVPRAGIDITEDVAVAGDGSVDLQSVLDLARDYIGVLEASGASTG